MQGLKKQSRGQSSDDGEILDVVITGTLLAESGHVLLVEVILVTMAFTLGRVSLVLAIRCS